MPTKRTPKNRLKHRLLPRITPMAVEIFRAMQDLPPCSCVAPPPGRWTGKQPCASCETMWELHDRLHAELVGPGALVNYPVIGDPDYDWSNLAPDYDKGAVYEELCRCAGRTTVDFWDRKDFG
jgi:hypothetical protein